MRLASRILLLPALFIVLSCGHNHLRFGPKVKECREKITEQQDGAQRETGILKPQKSELIVEDNYTEGSEAKEKVEKAFIIANRAPENPDWVDVVEEEEPTSNQLVERKVIDKEPSKALKRFNTVHWILIGLLGAFAVTIVFLVLEASGITIFLAAGTLAGAYIVAILQRFRFSKRVNSRERDRKFNCRFLLSRWVFTASTILLTGFLVLLIAFFIALS